MTKLYTDEVSVKIKDLVFLFVILAILVFGIWSYCFWDCQSLKTSLLTKFSYAPARCIK